jgi:hypothetical protein
VSLTTGIPLEQLYSLSTAITKNNYSAQAAFTGVLATNTVCKLPGGWLANDSPNPVGRCLILEVDGTIANTAAATFAMALGLDPTGGTIASSITVNAAYTPLASNTTGWFFRAKYTCTAFLTSTATFQVNGTIRYENVATGGAPVTTAQCGWFQGTQTLDPRIDNYIELFGTWSVANAANTTTVQQMDLFGNN